MLNLQKDRGENGWKTFNITQNTDNSPLFYFLLSVRYSKKQKQIAEELTNKLFTQTS